MESNLTIFEVGKVANQLAAQGVFSDFQSRKSQNTKRRHIADLELFSSYLFEKGIPKTDLIQGKGWGVITWGLVAGFVLWMLNKGYAITSVNLRLSTVKRYAELAYQAGYLPQEEYLKIRGVRGYKASEASNLDNQRKSNGVAVRKEGSKKAQAVTLTLNQAKALKSQPNTPQGLRDYLMIVLMLENGLRVGEIANLKVSDFDLEAGKLHFERPKVKKFQTHKLSASLLEKAKEYFALIPDILLPETEYAIRGSRKGGKIAYAGMSEQAITQRVRELGETIGVKGLSAHDLRHYWATRCARNKTPIDRLMDAGGWNSPAMPLRYIEAAKVANEGVIQDTD